MQIQASRMIGVASVLSSRLFPFANALLFAWFLLLSAPLVSAVIFTDISPPPGYRTIVPSCVRNDYVSLTAYNATSNSHSVFLFKISTKQLTLMPAPPQSYDCQSSTVNSVGDVGGTCQDPPGPTRVRFPVIWRQGQGHFLSCDAPGCHPHSVEDLADDGWAAATAFWGAPEVRTLKPMLVRPDYVGLVIPWALNLTATRIVPMHMNNRHDVVGFVEIDPSTRIRGFVLQTEKGRPTLLQDRSLAQWISDSSGTVAGELGNKAALWHYDIDTGGYNAQVFNDSSIVAELMAINQADDALGWDSVHSAVFFTEHISTAPPFWRRIFSMVPPELGMREVGCTAHAWLDDRSPPNRRQFASCAAVPKDDNREHAFVLQY